jgi:hypothetical protein
LASLLKQKLIVHDISRGHELCYEPSSGQTSDDIVHLRSAISRTYLPDVRRTALTPCPAPWVCARLSCVPFPPRGTRYTRNEEAALVSGDLEAGGHYDLLVH